MRSLPLVGLLSGGQISRTVEIRDARTVTVHMDGDTMQDRGRQQADVARDAGLGPPPTR